MDTSSGNTPAAQAFRRELRTTIAWTLAAKVAGLFILWALFFRGHAG